ncbi:Heparanase, partial [Eschrichtius robustus]|nr:Heparanase [Eschrichtius robustus]
SSKLRTLARGLSPAYLRFGGTKTDFLIFDPKKEPTFEERSYWQSQVNQDICESGSVPSDVERRLKLEWPFQEQLLLREQYQKKFKNSTYSKPNSFRKKAGIFIDGLQLGEDFMELHKLLRKSAFKNAKLYGPDVGQPRGKTVKMLKSFLKAGGEVIDSVTWHQWLDKLGLSARMGIEVVMRQVFFGAGNYHLVDENFEPLPDYWLSLLFKKLVGTNVLMASVKGPDRNKLRVYLHCTNINHYTVGLRSVQLNGQTLKMVDDQTLPALTEKPLRPGSSLGLPALSYGFFVIRNAKVAACI